jgi:GNAT superfamily N-acetyltransferase
MDINRQEDLNINAKYAEHFEAYYRYQLQSDKVTGYLAYLNENVVGSMLLISTDNFLEIDNLLTVSEFRKTGVASTLINHVKKLGLTENKRIILTADAEDYPKDIYLKMGFNILSSQIEIQKDLVL